VIFSLDVTYRTRCDTKNGSWIVMLCLHVSPILLCILKPIT